MALVMLQQPEARLEKLRKRLEKSVGDKHEEVMAKMGSIVASGILDAGGRNVTVGLRSRSGYFRRTSVIGLAIFTNYWCAGAVCVWGRGVILGVTATQRYLARLCADACCPMHPHNGGAGTGTRSPFS